MNSLAISIVVWNNATDAMECADSLLKQTIADDMKIVFIDNASGSQTIDQLTSYIDSKKNDRLVLVHTGTNKGTAGGFTAAAQWAESQGIEYIGALNADAVADPRWCESLLHELQEHPEAGIATGQVLHRDGKTIDSTGDFYNTWGIPGPRGRDKPSETAPRESEYVFGATGGSFLCRTSIYATTGYYDEKMFMYYEDIDFSFRAQLYGYKVRYNPNAIVYHKRGASSDTVPGLAVYNTFKNLPILFTKNVPLSLWPTIYPRFALAYGLILANAVKNKKAKSALKGFLMSWYYIPYMFHKRWTIQNNRKVNDTYIKSIIIHDIPEEQTGLRKFRKIFTGKA